MMATTYRAARRIHDNDKGGAHDEVDKALAPQLKSPTKADVTLESTVPGSWEGHNTKGGEPGAPCSSHSSSDSSLLFASLSLILNCARRSFALSRRPVEAGTGAAAAAGGVVDAPAEATVRGWDGVGEGTAAVGDALVVDADDAALVDAAAAGRWAADILTTLGPPAVTGADAADDAGGAFDGATAAAGGGGESGFAALLFGRVRVITTGPGSGPYLFRRAPNRPGGSFPYRSTISST